MQFQDRLTDFIKNEREIFQSYNTGINWDEDVWYVKNWLFHRGGENSISFKTQSKILKTFPDGFEIPPSQALPCPYIDFTKAVIVYLQRTKNINYMAVRTYAIECRRLHLIMHQRGETSPYNLTRWHFEETINILKAVGYKNIFDAAANLQVIAELIDKKELTEYPLNFKHGLKAGHKYFEYKTLKEIDIEDKRKDEEKLPSLEAMKAYALCTNNPINESEEILLRTIDLLIAMGQRANEVALLPYDCWVEKAVIGKDGQVVKDAYGGIILDVGIKYFAEKQFQSRVHWLAEQDVPFARRAVERLKALTEEPRKIANWQEHNPGKLWKLNPEDKITDDDLMQFIQYKHVFNLQNFLKVNKVTPVLIDKNPDRGVRFVQGGYQKRYLTRFHFRIADVESVLLQKLPDHDALKEKVNGRWKTVLKTSELLCISFDGAFNFKERATVFRVYPRRVTVKDINAALGSVNSLESIFQRRGLTEADGSKIVMTSHQPRHWRNTLYELAGMSNVQQALAMGRQRLDQNPTYQHTTLKERTQSQVDFLTFNSVADKVNFLHNGIRNNKIMGSITDTYNFLKKEKGIETAESFLKTHALALHITPFGGCTHDFSQEPCQKHLQCWNGCSHLHRTNEPGELERIKEQLELNEKVLKEMRYNSEEYGSDVWIKDLEKKIENLKKGLKLKPSSSPIQVFPDGIQMTIPLDHKRSSSVSE
ncbi:hypothetical protein [Sporocytophaga myxococcoides]|uniref:hypothetical protein n=1 Tax=Sporocytophaga myxococcoides TaxID=153721 RepID=UPI00041F0723|nr:hypothetical protein [Sporocytophaga myxococcoides]